MREWSEEEQNALTRKVDLRLIPFLSTLYFFSFLDRVNVGNVHTAMNEDLQLTESQYAAVVGVFFIGYILFELPSNLLMKRASPSRWLARIIAIWGAISVCLAFAQSFVSLLFTRFFLGVAEAGFFPGVTYYLTLWYPNSKLAMRIALFYVSATLAGAFGGLLAYFILNYMDGLGGLRAYRWLFIIEGLPSVILGIITWFYLPNSPAEASFLSEEEKAFLRVQIEASNKKSLEFIAQYAGESTALLVLKNSSGEDSFNGASDERTKFVDPDSSTFSFENGRTSSKGVIYEDDGVHGRCYTFWSYFFHIPTLRKTLASPFIWYFSICLYFPIVTCLYCSAFFLPALLQTLGLSIVHSNLMTFPLYLLAAVSTIVWSRRSDVMNERPYHLVVTAIVGGIGFGGLAFWNTGETTVTFWVAYTFSALALAGVYPCVPIVLSWLTNSVTSDIALLLSQASPEDQGMVKATYTATQTAVVVSVGNLGGIVGPAIYSQSLKYYSSYWIGHAVMCGLMGVTTLAALFANRPDVAKYLRNY